MLTFYEYLAWVSRFVRGLFHHDSSTRAASVELWVVVPAVLVFFQFVVGSMGPRFAMAQQINPGLQLLHTLSLYSVSYTLGLMKPSVSASKDAPASTANDFFQVWAVLIVTMQDSARIGRPYRPKEMSLVDLLSSLWSANQLRTHTALYLKVPLWVIWFIHASRIIWYYVSSNRAAGATDDNMKLVSDYMALMRHTDNDASPTTMTGYHYLVVGEDRQERSIDRPSFTFQLERTRPEELITVHKVWTWSRPSTNGTVDRLLGRHTDGDNKFKDVCLSFALYKMLRRRFYDFPIPEAKDPASRRLISDAILENMNDPNYDRVFRVTEVELSFLQDFSYSKHAVVFAGGFPVQRMMLSSFMVAAALYLAYAVRDIPSTSIARTANGRFARISHGVFVTHLLIFIVVCREMWEICVYVMSQWTKVLIVCHYVKLKLKAEADQALRPGHLPSDQKRGEGSVSKLQRLIVEKVARIMFSVIRRGQWDQQIQQHNLLMAAHVKTRNRRLSLRFVKLRSEVKTKIFGSLKALIISASPASPDENNSSESSTQRRNNDALKSYLRNGFAGSEAAPTSIEDILSELEDDTHKILVWHVATSLCQIELLEEAGREDDLYALPTPSFGDLRDLADLWPHYYTAATLSNYCVHLVEEALLPDNGLAASLVFDAVREEARDALRGCGTRKQIYSKLVADERDTFGERQRRSILNIGTELARVLRATYGRDELWACLGRFWVGYLLFLSASTRAAKHRIHLQGRGELTTHLWALLSHAGFLGEDTAHGQQLLDTVDLQGA